MMDNYLRNYFADFKTVFDKISISDIAKIIAHLIKLKKRKGRLFLIGVGGSAANCSHAVNDFRKICHIEAYTPADNVAELTARTNDDGWDTIFSNWLKGSNLNQKDAVLVFSVGGGNIKKNISSNIVAAVKYAKSKKSTILGIVSRNGGYTKKVAHTVVLIPPLSAETITPFAETFQAIIWHAIVNYPKLRNLQA